MSTSTLCRNVHISELPFHSISSLANTSLTIAATGCSSFVVMCCIVAAFLYFSTWISVFMVFPYLFTRDFSVFYMGVWLYTCCRGCLLLNFACFFHVFHVFSCCFSRLITGKIPGTLLDHLGLFVLFEHQTSVHPSKVTHLYCFSMVNTSPETPPCADVELDNSQSFPRYSVNICARRLYKVTLPLSSALPEKVILSIFPQ